MERKPCVFVSFRGQLQLLNCVSRVSEGSELPFVRGSHVRPPSSARPCFLPCEWPQPFGERLLPSSMLMWLSETHGFGAALRLKTVGFRSNAPAGHVVVLQQSGRYPNRVGVRVAMERNPSVFPGSCLFCGNRGIDSNGAQFNAKACWTWNDQASGDHRWHLITASVPLGLLPLAQ